LVQAEGIVMRSITPTIRFAATAAFSCAITQCGGDQRHGETPLSENNKKRYSETQLDTMRVAAKSKDLTFAELRPAQNLLRPR
jgi:hypothetical protein